MSISHEIKESITRASWIRKMFETGTKMKKEYGADKVFDFSLGNPDLISPPKFNEALLNEAKKSAPFLHGYMPNCGYPETRKVVADMLTKESGLNFTENNIIMTVGAAGGMNVILKVLLEKNDEVIVFTPYFAEYDFYISNHSGVKVMVNTTDDLLPDLHDLEKKITPKTKAVVINSPNNPTGRVYPVELYEKLSKILEDKSIEIGHPIYLLCDEPYKKIIFDDGYYYSPFRVYDNSILLNSFSKDLSLAGERIGYIGISPNIIDKIDIFNAATFCNRILGFVNAPALMQRVIKHVINESVDIQQYKERRDYLYKALTDIGYEIVKPEGTFYMFPKSPIEDDIKFIQILQKYMVLVTPGSGFHKKGHFRISFCVPQNIIKNSIPGFQKAFKEVKNL